MTVPTRELERILGSAGVTANVLSRRLRHIFRVIEDNRAGFPANTGYDTPRTSGGRTVLYCDHHEQELADCLKAGHTCVGTPVPVHSDPTGDAVASGADLAAGYAREIEQLVLDIAAKVDRLHRIGELLHPTRPLDRRGRKALEHNTPDLCEIHHLAGGRFPAVGFTDLTDAPTAVRVMPEKRLVCRWCRDYAISTGDWPTVAQAEANALGKKVRRPAHILRHRAS